MKHLRYTLIEGCFYLAIVLIILASLLNLRWPPLAGGVLTAGGALLAVYFLAQLSQPHSVRVRRLNRMGFFAGLLYVCSGGLLLTLSNYWILAFTIGSVLVIYPLMVQSYKAKKK